MLAILCKLSGWDRLTAALPSPVFRRAADTPSARPRRCALLGRARRLSLAAPDPALPGPGSGHRTSGFLEHCPGPPWAQRWSHCSGLGAILDAGSSSSAPIYARRYWRSPLMTRYLPAPGSLWILLLRPWALGRIPLPPEGGLGGGPKTRLPVWSTKAPGPRLLGILDGGSLALSIHWGS